MRWRLKRLSPRARRCCLGVPLSLLVIFRHSNHSAEVLLPIVELPLYPPSASLSLLRTAHSVPDLCLVVPRRLSDDRSS